MYTCPDSSLFSAYVDGEVPSPWKEKLEAHMSSCEDCSARVNKYENLTSLINSDIKEITPAQMANGLAKLELEIKRRRESKSRNTKPHTRRDLWSARSIRMPVYAFAAMILAAIFIPTLIVTRTNFLFQKNLDKNIAFDLANNTQYLQRLSKVSPDTAASIYSTDSLGKSLASRVARTPGQSLFTMLEYAKQYTTDKSLFQDAEIIIIRLPNLTSFNTFDSEFITPADPLQRNAGYFK